MIKHRMILTTIVTVLVVILGGVIAAAVWAFTRDDSAYEVTITTFPEEVQLQLGAADPVEHQGTATYTVEDEELLVAASRDEFTPHSETIQLADEPTEVTINLDPETEAAEEQWRDDADYFQGQADFTQDSLQHAEDLYEANEILQLLPKETETFRAYAGIPKDDDKEFGIHVYVYEGQEDRGEDEFITWAEGEGFDPAELDLTTHVEDAPPVTAPAPPTAEDLDQAEQPDVDAFEDDPAGLDADELALQFLTIANTHDASQEDTPSAAQQRAAGLMTDELAENLGVAENPAVPPNWWDAIEADAISYPWIYEITDERSNDDSRVHYTARVCWAWVPADGSTPRLDNPRTWNLVVAEDQSGTYQVTDYSYQDAYHGDDPTEGICSLD